MKKWMWIVLAIVVIGGAAAGVLYGVLTHKEAGFMQVCWENGAANYSDDCEPKLELRWHKDRLPLPVYPSLDAFAEKNYRDSIVSAAAIWNREVGEVFRFVDQRENALVIVSWGSKIPGEHAGGFTRHYGDPKQGPLRADVELSEPSDVHAVLRYATHEFGHVLGLAHDEAPRSIMYPIQLGMTGEMTYVLPSDHDKKLLKEAYGR